MGTANTRYKLSHRSGNGQSIDYDATKWQIFARGETRGRVLLSFDMYMGKLWENSMRVSPSIDQHSLTSLAMGDVNRGLYPLN